MLKGIFPPIPTPFINDELALDKLEYNIGKWNVTGLNGYVVMGSNGESAFLTRSEKIVLLSKVCECSSSDKIVIAGTGSDSIKETISLSNEAAEIGAKYALVLTPSFYKSKMTHEALTGYFTQVADSINIPVIIYNVPKFTSVNIDASTVRQLAEHENIIGIKNSSENIADLTQLVNNTPDDFSVLVGTASVLYPGLCIGAVGGIVALANIAAGQCVRLLDDYNAGKIESLLQLQKNLIAVNKAVTANFGVAGLKAAMDMKGYFGGLPRQPLQPLADYEKEELKNILESANLID